MNVGSGWWVVGSEWVFVCWLQYEIVRSVACEKGRRRHRSES